jgi:hypothetical protein
LHAGRTVRLAVAAGQATVQIEQGLFARGHAFQYLLNQLDAFARTVQRVARQLVGQTGSGAEAAVHAAAQDRIGYFAFARVFDEICEIGLPRSEFGVHPCGIEDTGRTECGLQVMVNLGHCRSPRMKHAGAFV